MRVYLLMCIDLLSRAPSLYVAALSAGSDVSGLAHGIQLLATWSKKPRPRVYVRRMRACRSLAFRISASSACSSTSRLAPDLFTSDGNPNRKSRVTPRMSSANPTELMRDAKQSIRLPKQPPAATGTGRLAVGR